MRKNLEMQQNLNNLSCWWGYKETDTHILPVEKWNDTRPIEGSVMTHNKITYAFTFWPMIPSSKNLSWRYSSQKIHTYKAIHCRNICNGKREEITHMSVTGKRVWNHSTVTQWSTMQLEKGDVDHLYRMLHNDLQDKLLHKKRWHTVCILWCHLSKKSEGDMNEYLF